MGSKDFEGPREEEKGGSAGRAGETGTLRGVVAKMLAARVCARERVREREAGCVNRKSNSKRELQLTGGSWRRR